MPSTILDHPIISERYFFPRPSYFTDPFWVESEGIKLGCYYHNAHPGSKTIICFHGNGEVVEDYLELYLPVFDKMGYNCFFAEFRGYGMSTGEPALAAMLDDVENIVSAIKLKTKDIVLFGRSIGSLYAIHSASMFPTISGLILESGIANILERLLLRVHPGELGVNDLQVESEVKKYFNHQKKIEAFQGSTLVLHARNDSLIKYTHGKQLFEWSSEPKTLKIFNRGDHNDIFFANYEEYIDLIKSFLADL